LDNVSWEELEAILRDLPEDTCLEEQDAYASFLQQLTEGDPARVEDDDSDEDYKDSNGYEDTEEYRTDKAVQISEKEMNALLAAMRESQDQTYVMPILPKVSLECIDTTDSFGFSRQQIDEFRTQFAEHLQLLIQIFFATSSHARYGSVASRTWNLLRELFAESKLWRRELLVSPSRSETAVTKENSPSSQQNVQTTPAPNQTTSSLSTLESSSEISSQPDTTTSTSTPTDSVLETTGNFERVARLLSLFLDTEDVPSSQPLFQQPTELRMLACFPSQQSLLMATRGGEQDAVPPAAPGVVWAVATFNNFSVLFDPALKGNGSSSKRKGRLKFTNAEDDLLTLGLRRFGPGSYELVQRYLLPTKTIPQLLHRFKNRCSAKAAWNPLKAFRKECKKLGGRASPEEVELLRQGIALHGFNWSRISSDFLPHREPSQLKSIWEHLSESDRPPSPPSSVSRITCRVGSPPCTFSTLNSVSPTSYPGREERGLQKEVPTEVVRTTKRKREDQELINQKETSEDVSSSTANDNRDSEGHGEQSTTWSRDEDRQILLLVKEMGATSSTWQVLAEGALHTKTPSQIEQRYKILLALFRELGS
jgi:hypothetical protein